MSSHCVRPFQNELSLKSRSKRRHSLQVALMALYSLSLSLSLVRATFAATLVFFPHFFSLLSVPPLITSCKLANYPAA